MGWIQRFAVAKSENQIKANIQQRMDVKTLATIAEYVKLASLSSDLVFYSRDGGSIEIITGPSFFCWSLTCLAAKQNKSYKSSSTTSIEGYNNLGNF